MSKQWNQVSSITKESTLLEVMSEELSKRLQIDEDFIWVEMPEAVREVCRTGNMGHFEVKTEDRSPSQNNSNITNVVQSAAHNAGFEPVEEKFSYHSDDDGDILPGNEEIIETDYVNQCIRNKVKAINPSQTKYPKPYWMKIREHAEHVSFNTENEKRQFLNKINAKLNSKNHMNELLPKMKFDASTTAVLEMLINNRYLGKYKDLVGMGKNSVLFQAYCSRKVPMCMPYSNVVKIYKTSKDEEKNKIIYRKVQREFKHLSMLGHTRELYGFPEPVKAWKNVIVMKFIGHDGKVAPSILDAPHEVDEELYNGIVYYIDIFYNVKSLVHGKLSAANILYWFKQIIFIGWSHSVKSDHPLAMTKLIKDCHFVTEFYKRRGVKVMPLKDVVQKITMQEPSEKLLEDIQGTKDLYSKYDTNPNRRTGRVKPSAPTNNRFKE